MKLYYDEMVEFSETKKELSRKVEMVGAHDVEIFTYAVSMTDTFDSELAKWFRGTVFDLETKECICRPFPKFFNLNEHAESKEDQVDWDSALYFHKMDGSLVMPVLFPDGDIYWKSKSTFQSAHARKAQELFMKMPERDRENIISLLEKGYTPLFEFISNDPEFRIVVEYPEEKLVYLGIVDIKTGRYMPAGVAVDVKREDIASLEGTEGFVIFDGEKLVKIKTAWYLSRSRAVFGFSKKAIIKATLDGEIDDIISTIAGLNLEDRLFEVEMIRDETVWELIALQEYVNDIYTQLKKELGEDYERKDFAMKVLTDIRSEYRKFFFALEDGRDITEMAKKYVFELLLNR